MSVIVPRHDEQPWSVFDVLGSNLRFGVTEDDRIFVVASDLAKVMGYRDAANITRLLDSDEKGQQMVMTHGGQQLMSTIYEDGIWELIFRSTRPEAKILKSRAKILLRNSLRGVVKTTDLI